ncbi:MAG: winged helix-turn-helix domain-containing protein [Actinomycetota bacterium]|nr:winged helix-turn-helix domain-containing protein [Actinomycetota bacterium]
MKPSINLGDAQLVKALTHPLRLQILRRLEEQNASPSVLAEELGAPLGNVSYHVRQLASLGLIELVSQTPRRGAIEHEYRAAQPRRPMSDDDWDRLPRSVREAVTGGLLEKVAGDVADAAAAGGFDRADARVSAPRLDLDERGWSEVGRELAALRERAGEIEAESRERGSDGGRSAALVLMLFEPADGRAADTADEDPQRR